MGDWPAEHVRTLYPHHTDASCAGCGKPVAKDEQHTYGDWDHIWHYTCWPKILAAPEQP